MFEFVNVPTESFLDTTDGSIVSTKSIHFITKGIVDRQINVNLRDVDLIARDELGDYEEVLKLCEQNAGTFVEYQMDISKINFLNIPV